jgi:hypothetical protein
MIAEFNSRTISWTAPAQLRTVAEARIREELRTGDSAMFRFDFTTTKADSIAVCGGVIAKNSDGVYTRFRRFYVETRDGALLMLVSS